MPDSTSRQGVGDITATVTKDEDKIRALKINTNNKGYKRKLGIYSGL